MLAAMAARRALIVMFLLSAACLLGHSLVAALSDEAAANSAAVCQADSSSAASSCAGVAADIAQGRQDDGLALLQHGSLHKQQAKPHASPQQKTVSLRDDTAEDEALWRRSAEVADERLRSNRSLLSTRGAQQPTMKDVTAAFKDLDKHSHVLRIRTGYMFPKGYDRGYMPYSEHFQGIQRQQDQNFLFISGSGQSSNMAQVFVTELGSRPDSGPMGTNMVSSSGKELKYPPTEDTLIDVLNVDGEFWHAGGMTSYGNYLVVGAEPGCSASDRVMGKCKDESRVHFYQTSDPKSPRKLPYVIERPDSPAGASALTQEPDGKFLLMVGRADSAILDFYLSDSTSLETDPGFKLVQTWYKKALLSAPGQDEDFGQYQSLNFVRQADGKLFMVGTYRTAAGLGDDTADLYEVDDTYLPSSVSIKKLASRHLSCEHSTCDFQAGSGLYVDSEDDLVIYSTNWEPEDDYIYVNEFRGKSVGVGGGCARITPGSCSWLGCSKSRGPTDCIDDVCVCKKGYCHADGKCIPEAR